MKMAARSTLPLLARLSLRTPSPVSAPLRGRGPAPPSAMLTTSVSRCFCPTCVHSSRSSLRVRPLSSLATSPYSAHAEGDLGTPEFRIFFKQGSKVISPWHDIPMRVPGNEGLVHFVCEIPKETKAKMEVALDEASNPVKQDTKKGKLRDYPYNINWNYGLIPQTWEDPAHENAEAGGAGDNDPVDVVEIGGSQLEMGGVYQVKPIGCYAMIDEGELDWKVIAINSEDPLFEKVNSLEDVETHFPGELQKILEWFRDYKTPDGKPQNAFGYDNKCMPTDFTWKVINETHEFWTSLKNGSRENSEDLWIH